MFNFSGKKNKTAQEIEEMFLIWESDALDYAKGDVIADSMNKSESKAAEILQTVGLRRFENYNESVVNKV